MIFIAAEMSVSAIPPKESPAMMSPTDAMRRLPVVRGLPAFSLVVLAAGGTGELCAPCARTGAGPHISLPQARNRRNSTVLEGLQAKIDVSQAPLITRANSRTRIPP